MGLQVKNPIVYHREYENDLPKQNAVQSQALSQALRLTQVALPFIALYKPVSQPLSIVLGATRVVCSFTQMANAISSKDSNAMQRSVFEVAIASTALACSILAHPLGMVVTTAHDMVINVCQLTQAIEIGDYKKAGEIALHLANNALYLSCFFAGSLELSIASIGLQICLGLYNSNEEFKKGNYLEGCAHMLMAGIRGKQMHDQVKMLQLKWELDKIKTDLTSGVESKTDSAITKALATAQVNGKNSKFLEKVEALLAKDPTTLDLSAEKVTDDQLVLLAKILPESQVKTLNLSNNPFEYIGMIALAKALPKTQIMNLNLSSTSGKAIEKLIEILPQSKIEVLDLYGLEMSEKDLATLSWTLPSTRIRDLDLGYNEVSEPVFEFLMMMLPYTKLERLSLYHCGIEFEDDDVIRHVEGGIAGGNLIELNLGWNPIGDIGAAALAEALPFSKIKKLDISSCHITESGAEAISKALPSTQIEDLDMSENYLGSEGLSALAQSLDSSLLQKLNLAYDQERFDVASLEDFKEAVIRSRIKDLSVGFNEIGVDGAKIIAEILEKGHLESLDLRCDRSIGSEGAKLIAESLKHSDLKQLTFDSNRILDEGAVAILKVIPDSKVESLDLRLNGMTDESLPALLDAMERSSLRHVELSSNSFSKEAREKLTRRGKELGISVEF